MKNDAGDRRTRLGDRFAKEVSDSAEFHPRFHVRATLDERVKNAELVGEDVNDFFEPHWILNGMRLARQHFQSPHRAERAVHEQRHIVGFNRAGVTRFHNDRRFAPHGSGVIKVARGGRVGGAFAPDNDVIEAESKDHLLGNAVLGFPARWSPVGIRAKALVKVATVVVD